MFIKSFFYLKETNEVLGTHKTVIRLLTWLCVSIYAIFMLYICLQPQAMVPDELWFLRLVRTDIEFDSVIDILRVPNYLGYGSIYWVVMKLLDKFLLMRLFSFFMLVSIPVCIIMTDRKLGLSDRGIFYSILLYFSCPLSWFTGKIIGPEIMGWGVGVWGSYYGLTALLDADDIRYYRLFLGSVIIGISTGIKLNYVVFLSFVLLYMAFTRWFPLVCEKRIAVKDNIYFIGLVCLVIISFLAGIVVANPIVVIDFETFKSMYSEAGGYSLKNIYNVIWGECIEWDLVNSGGMNKTIISIVAFFMIILSGWFCRKSRDLIVASMLSIVILIGLCCKTRFLGWYLLPLIYLTCIIVPDIKLMPVILAVNLMFMWPHVTYQITSKIDQISMMQHTDAIEDITNSWEGIYPDYTVYYFIEVCMDKYPMFPSYQYDREENNRRLLFISKRARENVKIRELYNWGIRNENGYQFIEER